MLNTHALVTGLVPYREHAEWNPTVDELLDIIQILRDTGVSSGDHFTAARRQATKRQPRRTVTCDPAMMEPHPLGTRSSVSHTATPRPDAPTRTFWPPGSAQRMLIDLRDVNHDAMPPDYEAAVATSGNTFTFNAHSITFTLSIDTADATASTMLILAVAAYVIWAMIQLIHAAVAAGLRLI